MLKEKYFVLIITNLQEGEILFSDFFKDNQKLILPPDCECVDNIKIRNVYFIIDRSGDKTEEELSSFYRNILIQKNQFAKCKVYIKRIKSLYPII